VPSFQDDVASLTYALQRQNLNVPEVVLPTDVDVVLRGMRFHYLDWGNQGKRVVLFLHGGGLNAHTFDLVCLALRVDYHCLSLDQRGHGDSEWSPVVDYEISTHAADLAAFVERLELRDFVLVGMSMGGLNAIQYVGDHAAETAALVLIDTGPEMQSAGGERIRQFLSQPGELDSVEDFVARALEFNPRRDEQLLRRSLLHNLRRTPEGKWTWKWDPRPRIRGIDSARWAERRARLWEDVERVTCPTLVVRGAQSDVFSAENAAMLVRRLQDGRTVEVDDSGHTVQGDNPAGLVRVLRRFFAEVGIH
jgi:pimeloyl-ACP methyl ester carboxylesterase